MKNLSKIQFTSLVVATIAALAGFIATLGQIWGFEQLASQISETCFATSGFASIVLGGNTLGKAAVQAAVDKKASKK